MSGADAEGEAPTADELMAEAEVAEAAGPRRFKAYTEYKDSGVEWLGEIPASWSVLPARRLCTRVTDGAHVSPDTSSPDVPFVSTVNLNHGEIDFEGALRTSRESYAYMEHTGCRPRCGDVLFSKDGTVGATALVVTGREFAVASSLVILSPDTTRLDPKWLAYWLNSALVKEHVDLVVSGAALRRISVAKVGRLPVMYSERIDEQRSVSAFLDSATERIDALVRKKERLIELLQEKRAALITRAVTKGLDPDAPMKDSGVEWLGQIPAHWDAYRTKHVARLESGHTPSRQHPEYWENCTVPWFGLADVWQIRDGRREYIAETAEKVSELGLAHSSARLLPKGTVILSRTASVGFSAIMGTDMATTQDFVNWVCGPRIQPEYLLYVFRSMTNEFRRLTMGSTHQTIYMPDVGRFGTPVPPVAEQRKIVAHIREEAQRIDGLSDKVQQAIDRLREFRTALISAAVTGKIDVREEVA